MKKICSVSNCGKISHSRGYCQRHYRQIRLYGKVLERTMHDRNDFKIINDDYAVMNVYNRKNEKVKEVLVDIEDVERLQPHKWCMSSNKEYIGSFINGKQVSLHRFILNYNGKLVIDHINRNTFDNRKSNLRIVTRSQNAMNSCAKSTNKTGIKGVSISNNTSKKWKAQIFVNGKGYAEYFETKDEAIQKRKEMELEYHGEFAPSWWEENKC